MRLQTFQERCLLATQERTQARTKAPRRSSDLSSKVALVNDKDGDEEADDDESAEDDGGGVETTSQDRPSRKGGGSLMQRLIDKMKDGASASSKDKAEPDTP